MDQQDKYSPYCPVCSACGEEGCCSPINCTQAPDGHYCQSYLLDLHLAYRMDKYFMENIYDELSDELRAKYDTEWNRVYDEVYGERMIIDSQDEDEDDTFSLYEDKQTKSIRELANKQNNKK